MPTSFHDLGTVNAFFLTADYSSFTTSSGSKVNTEVTLLFPKLYTKAYG